MQEWTGTEHLVHAEPCVLLSTVLAECCHLQFVLMLSSTPSCGVGYLCQIGSGLQVHLELALTSSAATPLCAYARDSLTPYLK